MSKTNMSRLDVANGRSAGIRIEHTPANKQTNDDGFTLSCASLIAFACTFLLFLTTVLFAVLFAWSYGDTHDHLSKIDLYHWDRDIIRVSQPIWEGRTVATVLPRTGAQNIYEYCEYMMERIHMQDAPDVFGLSNAWVDAISMEGFSSISVDASLYDANLLGPCIDVSTNELKCLPMRSQRQIMVYAKSFWGGNSNPPMQATMDEFEARMQAWTGKHNRPATYISASTELYHYILSNGGTVQITESGDGTVMAAFYQKASDVITRIKTWLSSGWATNSDVEFDAETVCDSRFKRGRCGFIKGAYGALATTSFVLAYFEEFRASVEREYVIRDIPSANPDSYVVHSWSDMIASGVDDPRATQLMTDLVEANPYSIGSKPSRLSKQETWIASHPLNKAVHDLSTKDRSDNVFKSDYLTWYRSANAAVNDFWNNASKREFAWSLRYTPYERFA